MTKRHETPAGSSTFARYIRFQVPGVVVLGAALIAAVRYDLVALPMAVGLLLLWIAKDLALYPLLKRAYEPSGRGYPSRLIGSCGRAREDLTPQGYVFVAGELWRAEAEDAEPPIRAGEAIMVTGAVGTRVRVRRGQGTETDRSA